VVARGLSQRQSHTSPCWTCTELPAGGFWSLCQASGASGSESASLPSALPAIQTPVSVQAASCTWDPVSPRFMLSLHETQCHTYVQVQIHSTGPPCHHPESLAQVLSDELHLNELWLIRSHQYRVYAGLEGARQRLPGTELSDAHFEDAPWPLN
jgi:hypothetical protein